MRRQIKQYLGIVAFLLIGALCINTGSVAVQACSTVSECQNSINSAAEQRKKLESEIANSKQEVASLQSEVENILKQIATYTTQIDSASKTILVLDEQSKALEKSMKETEELLKRRLVEMQLSYESNQNLNFIADSSSITEMIERSQAVTALTESDQGLVTKYDAQNKQVLFNKAETEKQKKELEGYKEHQVALQAQKQIKINEYRSQIAELEAESSQAAVSQELSEAQLKEIEAALARVKTTPSVNTTTPGVSANSGLRPMNHGWITAEYGETQYHTIPHNGTDFAPLNGDNAVYSMVDGVVVANLFNSARGYLIAIAFNDGSGYKTLMYQHLASAGVPIGTVVTKGQQVGIAGTTGSSSGVHLHAEVGDAKMVGGSPTWVDRGASAGPGLYATEVYFGIPSAW